MEKKNVILTDNSLREMEDYRRGVSRESGMEWEVLVCRANQGRRGIWNFLRYLKYFCFPFFVFLRRKSYGNIIAWQTFYGVIFAFWCRVFRVEKSNFLVVKNFTYREKKGIIGKIYFRFMKWIVTGGYVDVFAFCSKGHMEYCGELFGIPKEKLCFETFGVEDIGKSPDYCGDYILSIGRSNRDWEFLIRELRNVEFSVKIVCDTLKTGDLPANIRVYNNIWGEDALEFLRNCRLVVLPILDERVAAGDTVLLQAICLGKPVVAARESGVWEEYIESGETGFVIPKNGEILRETVGKLWNDQELYGKISRNSRAHFVKNFSLYGYGCRIGRLFKEKENGKAGDGGGAGVPGGKISEPVH